MIHSWLIHDMIRIDPQTGYVLEKESLYDSFLQFDDAAYRSSTPRNAWLSFQIVIETHVDDDDDVDVVVGSLKGDQGGIEATEYALFVQWYHQIQGRYVPDGLVPWGGGQTSKNPFYYIKKRNAVANQKYAAIWIDLFVPLHTLPGNYMGTVHVTKGGAVDKHAVMVKVLKTAMPNESTLTMDLNSYADNISRRMLYLRDRNDRYTDGTYFRAEQQFYQLAHEHRCLFHYLPYEHSGKIPESFVPIVEGKGKSLRVIDWSLFDEHYGPYLDGSAFRDTKRGSIPLPYMYLPFNFHWPADYAKFGTKGYATEFRNVLRQFHDHFTEMGWLFTRFELFLNHKKRYKLFPYDGDETRFVWDEKINAIYYAFAKEVLEQKEGAKFIFRTDSSWSYGLHFQKYADMIKLWVVNEKIFSWFPEGLQHLQDNDCTVWAYGGAQRIGQSLLGTAISPLSSVARGSDGFVYWESTLWGDQWHISPTSDGAATMFYPGDRLFGIMGPIPSIRLKVLRNAMQVAEGMELWIQHNPQPGRKEVTEWISRAIDMESASWWAEKPGFIHLPPYEWSNSDLSDAAATRIHKEQPPEVFNDLRNLVWEKLG